MTEDPRSGKRKKEESGRAPAPAAALRLPPLLYPVVAPREAWIGQNALYRELFEVTPLSRDVITSEVVPFVRGSDLWEVTESGDRKQFLEGVVYASTAKNAYRAIGTFDAHSKDMLSGIVYCPPELPAFAFNPAETKWEECERPPDNTAAFVILVRNGIVFAIAHLSGANYTQANVEKLFAKGIYTADVDTTTVPGCSGKKRFDRYVGSMSGCTFTGPGRLTNQDGARVEEGMFVAGMLHGNGCKVVRQDDGIARNGRYVKGFLAHGTITVPRGENEPILWVHGDVERRGSGDEIYEVIRGAAGSGVAGDCRIGLFKLEDNVFSAMGPAPYVSREYIEDCRKWRRHKGTIEEYKCIRERMPTMSFGGDSPVPDVFHSLYRFIGVSMFEGTGEVVSTTARDEYVESEEMPRHLVLTKPLEGNERTTRIAELNDMKMPTTCGKEDCPAVLADVSAGAQAFTDDHSRVPVV